MKEYEDLPEMMTIHEVAEKLSVAYHTVFKWIHNKELHAVRIGKKVWRVPKESFISFIEGK